MRFVGGAGTEKKGKREKMISPTRATSELYLVFLTIR